MGESAKSYIISVSAGTGCYRHIRMPDNATLLDFCGEILRMNNLQL